MMLFQVILYFISLLMYARLDQEIHDRAIRGGRPDLGIGNNKQSRIVLRGSMIVLASLSEVHFSFVLSLLGFSLLWIPLFNMFLASIRKYNDDTPELGDTGIDAWFQQNRGIYNAYKVIAIILGIGCLVLSALFRYSYL